MKRQANEEELKEIRYKNEIGNSYSLPPSLPFFPLLSSRSVVCCDMCQPRRTQREQSRSSERISCSSFRRRETVAEEDRRGDNPQTSIPRKEN
jgi:hypothetical protein